MARVLERGFQCLTNPKHEKRERDRLKLVQRRLSRKAMVKNRKLARAISDAAWTTFRRFLEYKAAWYGRAVVVIDRWHPSSKTCSTCGLLHDHLPLNVREWTCTCGVTHDRDVNAAKNILAAGLAVTACGDGIRPARA